MTPISLEQTSLQRLAVVQRLASVAAGSWVHGAWHEAVIGLPGSAATSMTGIVGAAVIPRGRLQVLVQMAVESQLLGGLNSHGRLITGTEIVRMSTLKQSLGGTGAA